MYLFLLNQLTIMFKKYTISSLYIKHFCFCIWLMLISSSQANAYTRTDVIKGYNHSMALKVPPQTKVDTLYKMYRSTFYIDLKLGDSLAHKTLAYAEKIGYKRGKGLMYIILAMANERLGQLNLTNQYSQKALDILTSQKAEKDLPLAYYIRGMYNRRKKLTSEALNCYLQALKIAEKLNDKPYIRLLSTSVAIIEVGQKQYNKALYYHQKAFDVAADIKDSVAIQMCYSNIGIVYSRKKDYAKALQYHQKALQLAQKLDDKSAISFSYNDLGSTSLYLKQYDKAIADLKKSIAIRQEINEMQEIAYTYNYLGQVYKETGNKTEAIKWIKKALQTAQKIENTKQEQEAYEELYLLFSHFKQYDSAYVYSRKYHLYADSINKIANEEAMNEMLVAYEADKKDQQLKTLGYENQAQELALKQRRNLLVSSILALVAVVVIGYLLFNRRIQKEKQRALERALENQLEQQRLKREADEKLFAERSKISRDLHDNVGGQLSYIIYSLDGINHENEETRTEVTESVSQSVRSVIGSLRETIWAISDANIKVADFADKLKIFTKNLFKHTQTKVVFNEDLKEDRELNALLGLNLYRICQEVLNNAFKHAKSNHVEIKITSQFHKLEIAIIDDGIGFEESEAVTKGSYGINNIKSRASEFGIDLQLTAQLGKGTHYLLVV